MSFSHIVKAKYPNGVEESRVQELDSKQIVIGRGSDCDLRLESDQIDLRHLSLKILEDSSLEIEDLGSLSGTWVNEESVKKATLKSGDVLRLADVRLELSFADGRWILEEARLHQAQSSDADDELEKAALSLDIRNVLPSMFAISFFLMMLVIFYFLYKPLYTSDKNAWTAGPISKAHEFIEADCASCHAAPFESVQDFSCLACHQMESHGDSDLENCASCHMEHSGSDGLILSESRTCTSCHANIQGSAIQQVKIADVHSLDNHPEFNLPKKDKASLKLNHRIHLQKNLRSSDGLTTLSCNSCHKLDGEGKLMKEITFEESCSSCHPLSFDDKLPEEKVPHGNEDEVFKFLYASYSQLYLNEEGQEREEIRRRIRPGRELTREEEIAFIKEEVLKISRKTEKELFNKTSCNLCHEVSPSLEVDPKNREQSIFSVEDPNVPSSWMHMARFDHSAHDFVNCSSCHLGASKSEATEDVLMPGIKDCQSCHAENKSRGVMKSDCTLCHSYHDQLELPETRKAIWHR